MQSNHTAIQNLADSLRRCHRLLTQATDRTISEASYVENHLHDLQTQLDALILDLDQEVPFTNHETAFSHARDTIRDQLRETPNCCLRIQILAVASSFSWPFISKFLPQMLDQYADASVQLEWLLSDPATLNIMKVGTNSDEREWSAVSEARHDELITGMSSRLASLNNRFCITAHYYPNVPHWHGVLLNDVDNDDELLLGRTSWDWTTGTPNLRVGENEYRMFHASARERGGRRIDLFREWFRYYQFIGRQIFPIANERAYPGAAGEPLRSR